MAEVQTNTQMGELSQRFVEFVMMQAQNAALFLGQIPNPQTGKGEVNLELAKMFIDQLAMIQEKTRGKFVERRNDGAAQRDFQFADGFCGSVAIYERRNKIDAAAIPTCGDACARTCS